MRFKSERHERYAAYLSGLGLEWHYREFWTPYLDELTGSRRRKYVDFTVQLADGSTEWVECLPSGAMTPTTGRIAVSRRAEDGDVAYRGLTAAELELGL